jgi:hypothetical protein
VYHETELCDNTGLHEFELCDNTGLREAELIIC